MTESQTRRGYASELEPVMPLGGGGGGSGSGGGIGAPSSRAFLIPLGGGGGGNGSGGGMGAPSAKTIELECVDGRQER
jgi:hypothetical protein